MCMLMYLCMYLIYSDDTTNKNVIPVLLSSFNPNDKQEKPKTESSYQVSTNYIHSHYKAPCTTHTYIIPLELHCTANCEIPFI